LDIIATKNMEIKFLQILLMDNGEILCDGVTIGWEKKLGKYLRTNKEIVDRENAKKPL